MGEPSTSTLSAEDFDLVDYIAGRGRWVWLGGSLTTYPEQGKDHDELHARCIALAKAGLIVGEDYGLWWVWRAAQETIH